MHAPSTLKSSWKLVLGAVAMVGLAIPFLAHADDLVDCTGVSRWSHDHKYKKGDRALKDLGGNSIWLYECKQNECNGGGDELNIHSDIWRSLGWCKSGTVK